MAGLLKLFALVVLLMIPVCLIDTLACGSTSQPLMQLPRLLTPGSSYQAQGNYMKVNTVKPDGTIFTESLMSLRFQGISVRNHTFRFVMPGPDAATSTLLFADCDCEWTMVEDHLVSNDINPAIAILEPLDARRSELRLNVQCPFPYNATKIAYQLSAAPKDYTITYINTTNSQQVPLVYDYKTGNAKFGIEIENWPWNEFSYYPGRSYLSLDWKLGVLLDTEGTVQTDEGEIFTNHVITTKNSKFTWTLEKGFVSDNIPYLDKIGRPTNETRHVVPLLDVIELDLFTKFKFTNYMGTGPEEPILTGKSFNIFYDPSFSLFTGNVDVTQPTDKKRTVRIAVGVSVAALVVLLVLGMVLQFNGVADFVYPFRKRDRNGPAARYHPQTESVVMEDSPSSVGKSGDTGSNELVRESWTKGSKPEV